MAKFTFDNPSGSAFFTMATALDTGRGFTGATEGSSSYDSTFSLYASGSFTSFTGSTSVTQQTFLFNDGIVQSNYIWSCVVPPGSSSFTFNNAITIPASTVLFKGTGEFSVKITN